MLWLVPGPMGWLGYGLAECHLSSGGYRVVSRRVGGNGDGARNCFIMSREKQTNEGLNVKDGCIGYNL